MEREDNLMSKAEITRLRLEIDNLLVNKQNDLFQKRSIENNANDFERRITLQIEENQELRIEKAAAIANSELLQKKYNTLQATLNIFQEKQLISNQLNDASNQSSFVSSRDSDFKSVNVSLDEDQTTVAEVKQLRSEIDQSRENESLLKTRNEKLENKVQELEERLASKHVTMSKHNEKFDAKMETVENLLKRQNKSLEEQLTIVREQAIVERQSARSANLTVWKLEKELKTNVNDQTALSRKLKLYDERLKLLENEKKDLERKIIIFEENNIIKQTCIDELNSEVTRLKNELLYEHSKLRERENLRMKEKSEKISYLSTIQKLEIQNEDLGEKLVFFDNKNGKLIEENILVNENSLKKQHIIDQQIEKMFDLEHQLENTLSSYNLLKGVCQVMEIQLEEMENMLNRETKQNSVSCDKNDQLWTKICSKDDEIIKLKHELNEQKSLKYFSDSKIEHIQSEFNQMKTKSNQLQIERDHHLNRIVDTSNSLLEAQEKIEKFKAELTNVQQLNCKYEQQLSQFKEEKTKLLTEFYFAKEEISQLSSKLAEASDDICFEKREHVVLKTRIHDQKNYFEQKIMKLEATVAQLQKLAEFLQLHLEQSNKKKGTFADRLFGLNVVAKKENITPNKIATSASYGKIQDDLKKTQIRRNYLAQELIKAKTDIQTMQRKYFLIIKQFHPDFIFVIFHGSARSLTNE
jgi:citron Rho-interacting kinase